MEISWVLLLDNMCVIEKFFIIFIISTIFHNFLDRKSASIKKIEKIENKMDEG